MASYRPFPPPPQSTFTPPPPNQNNLQPPPPPPSRGGNQYSQNWGPYSGNEGPGYNQSYSQTNPSSNFQHFNPPARNQHPPPPPQQQPFQYQPPPPPPPPDSSSYPPPPPPPQSAPGPPMYYPSSQYSQFNQPPPVQPPPPPPPPSSPPPPPPPSHPSSPPPLLAAVPPPAGATSENRQPNAGASSKKDHKPPQPSAGKGLGGPGTSHGVDDHQMEMLKRFRRSMDRQRQEEKQKQHLRESQNKVLQKTNMLASGSKGHGSISGSHMGDRRSTPLLSGDRIENRLKKPTTFLCKLKFRNELPDPSEKIKLLSLKRDPDRYCKYQITSLEKNWKPQLYVEPNLGIPLDLLDLSVYNPPGGERIPLDPEDEELLHDDDPITPIKADGIKKKERPTDKGVSWLVKTQYISPLSMESSKQSLTEKQAKELRESRDRLLLENHNSRERKIQDIVSSFEACKSKPVHSVNRHLQPKRVLPLFPDFDRYEDQFVVANFDSAPTADSEIYGKLNAAERDEFEHRAIMKSFKSSSSDTEKDKFLAYMVPSVDELEKDMFDANEDISYSWVREYHWDVRGDDVDDPTTYLVAFGEDEAKYLPLPTKLILRKKRAREGKSSEEVEQFPVPRSVTVRRRKTLASRELRDEGDFETSKSRYIGSRNGGRLHRMAPDMDGDNFSEPEDDMSE